MIESVAFDRSHMVVLLLTYLILEVDEVGLCRRMSFNCPSRYIDPAGCWTCPYVASIQRYIKILVESRR